MANINIGTLYACIDGDHRYASRINVNFDDIEETITITRSENGAVGGMDGPGGAFPFGVTYTRKVPRGATPKAIIDAIWGAFDNTVTRYGKPTKTFQWTRTGEKGISVAKLKKALDEVKEASV